MRFDLVAVTVGAIERVGHLDGSSSDISDDQTQGEHRLGEIGPQEPGRLDVGEARLERLMDRAQAHPQAITQELEQRDAGEITRTDALPEAR